jgi:hypothetical protein
MTEDQHPRDHNAALIEAAAHAQALCRAARERHQVFQHTPTLPNLPHLRQAIAWYKEALSIYPRLFNRWC